MPIALDTEIPRLRTALRDLVALSTIPAAWVGRDPSAIATGLGDVLVGSLHLDFAFVRLRDPNGGAVVEVTRGSGWKDFPQWLQRRLGGETNFSRHEIVPNIDGGAEPCRGVVIPIGVDGEGGLVAAASDRPDFPAEIDQLLLSVAANQAATAFQNARLIHERKLVEERVRQARDELELEVVGRTAELRESERRWRNVFENNPTMYFVVDTAGTILSVNPFGAEQLGYTVDELVGQSVLIVFPEAEQVAARQHVASCLEDIGQSKSWEIRKVRKDGTQLWVRETGRAVTQEADRPIVLIACEDVTASKDAEEALLQAAEERHAHLWFLESLDRVNRAIQGTNDLEQMMSDVLDAVLSIFDCDRAWLAYPCDPAAASWRVPMEHTRPEFPGAFVLGPDLPLDEDVARVFRAGRAASGPVRFGPESEHPVPPQLTERLGIQSMIAMTVYPKVDKPYMVGLHQCSYPRVWTPQEERLFQEIARRLTDGLTTLLIFRNLRESEARLADAQRIAHVAYWERDLDSDGMTFSDEGYRIVGLTPRELPMSAAEIRARIHPDDLAMQARALAEAIGGGSRYNVEYRLVRPTGEVRIVHSQGDVVRDELGRPRRMFGILQDITERRGAEYLTKQVFETLPDGVAVIGRDYRYRRVNPVYERYFEMPAERIVGMHVVERAGVMFEQTIKPRLDRCFAGEEATYAEWVDGVAGHKYLSMTYSPLRSTGSDRVDTALVITRDLTEYMLASEALQLAQAELARVTRVTMLGEITASIAHEVNQPLAAVVMNGNACRRWLGADPPNLDEAREAAKRVVSDGERAGKIIARIRTLARRGTSEQQVLDVNDVIREALAVTRSELERQGVAIEPELSEGLPAILGDRVQLQQVLVNLVLNAGDAMADVADVSRELTVASRRVEDASDSDGVLVEVKDRGRGLDGGQAERIFDPFYSTKPGGLGMGLAISRSIVEKHGGRIWAVANDDGPGATMRFALPPAPRGD
jgi:PAS domain S-box-containing protein